MRIKRTKVASSRGASETVALWPRYRATLSADAGLTLNGVEHHYPDASTDHLRAAILSACARVAQHLRRPVRLNVTERGSTWDLAVRPSGVVQSIDAHGTIDQNTAGLTEYRGPCGSCGAMTSVAESICAECGGAPFQLHASHDRQVTATVRRQAPRLAASTPAPELEVGPPPPATTPVPPEQAATHQDEQEEDSSAPPQLLGSANTTRYAGAAKERPRGGPVLIIGALVVLALAIVGASIYFVASPGTDSTDASGATATSTSEAPTTSYMPALAPRGYDTAAAWSADLAEGTHPIVAADGLLAITRPDGSVEVVDPRSGEALYTSPTYENGVSSLLPITQPTRGFVWAADDTMHVWTGAADEADRAADEEVSFDIPAGAGIYAAGAGPMLWVDGATEVYVLVGDSSDLRLSPVTIPDGTTPLGVDGDGHVISSTGRLPLWRTPPDGQPVAVPIEAPDGAEVRKWVGMSGSHVAIAWTTGKADTVAVRLHNTETGEAAAAAELPWPAVEDAQLVTDQTQTVVAAGPFWADLSSGTVVTAQDTSTQPISLAGRRYALRSGVAGVINDQGEWTALPDGTAVPLGLGPDDEAIVRVSGRGYALNLSDSN